MSYIDGHMIAAAADNKEAYRAIAIKYAMLLKEFGATRIVERRGGCVARRQSHRLQARGESRGWRERSVVVDRVAVKSGARRRPRKIHERPTHEGARRHAVRRQAHGLRRL